MRKKTMTIAAVLFMTLLLAGCGKPESKESGQNSEDKAPERIVMKDLDVDQYVTLGDYKGIRVEKQEVKVNDSDLEEVLHQVYVDNYPEELGIKDRAVENGDTANIDYSGKLDGVAFEGGTAEGSCLTIGSHSFIEGFEDGLVGVKPGETVDLNLKFPNPYPNNPDLAGKDAVFTVTVNFIIPPEKTDEAVKYFGIEEVTNLEELRQFIYDYLYQVAENQVQENFEDQVMDTFMTTCEFKEIPENYFKSYREETMANIAMVAASYGIDAESYVNYYYRVDLQTFYTYCDDSLRQSIAIQAVANKEGLAVSDDELNETLQQYAAQAQVATVEEYIGNVNIEEYRDLFTYQKVYNFLMETAEIEK